MGAERGSSGRTVLCQRSVAASESCAVNPSCTVRGDLTLRLDLPADRTVPTLVGDPTLLLPGASSTLRPFYGLIRPYGTSRVLGALSPSFGLVRAKPSQARDLCFPGRGTVRYRVICPDESTEFLRGEMVRVILHERIRASLAGLRQCHFASSRDERVTPLILAHTIQAQHNIILNLDHCVRSDPTVLYCTEHMELNWNIWNTSWYPLLHPI